MNGTLSFYECWSSFEGIQRWWGHSNPTCVWTLCSRDARTLLPCSTEPSHPFVAKTYLVKLSHLISLFVYNVMTCRKLVFGFNKTTSMPAHVCYKSKKGTHLFQYQIKLIRDSKSVQTNCVRVRHIVLDHTETDTKRSKFIVKKLQYISGRLVISMTIVSILRNRVSTYDLFLIGNIKSCLLQINM